MDTCHGEPLLCQQSRLQSDEIEANMVLTLQVAASAVEMTGSKAALKAAFGNLMTAETPKVSIASP